MLVLEPVFEADLPPEQYAHRLNVSLESSRMIAVIGAAACEHSRLLPLALLALGNATVHVRSLPDSSCCVYAISADRRALRIFVCDQKNCRIRTRVPAIQPRGGPDVRSGCAP